MTQDSKVVILQGGLDVVTPAMMVKPGFAISGQNYECEVRGYRRTEGYERFDGREKPSEPDYGLVSFGTGVTAIMAGDVVTGATSGATGTVVIDATPDSGTWAGGDAAGELLLMLVSGAFVSGEALQVSAATVATSTSISTINAALNDVDDAAFKQLVTAAHRARIEKPAGSGPVRGVATYRGDVYCWRDNVGGTAGQMFKATSAGWVLQTFGHYIEFDAGSAEFIDGETVTGTTSGATATIERSVLRGGAYDGAGLGYLVISGITGTFVDNEAITSASGAAVAVGTAVAVELPPGGKYRSETTNFYADESFERLYFVNGVGFAHEWDGTVLAPILTGTATLLDKPTHIGIQKFHLFLSFQGGSLQHSGPGEPLVFNALDGAGEIGFGQDVTGIRSEYRDSMIITGQNKVAYITGTSAADFDLKTVSLDSGAVENSLEVIGKPIFLDDRGLRDMQAVQQFGDWNLGTITRQQEPLFKAKREAGVLPTAALRVRGRDQYRIFFSDGSGFSTYFGRKYPETMPITLGFVPYAMYSGEASDGSEILFAADSDGYVYELDKGTSFDGDPIEAYLRLAFDHQGIPNAEKRYHRGRLEGNSSGPSSSVTIAVDYTYGESNAFNFEEDALLLKGNGGFFNESIWNEFQWSTAVQGQAFATLGGIGENISIAFVSESATEEAHTLSTLTIFYTKRRKKR